MYRPSDEALMQLGLYDYVWGDNAMLQNYLSRLSEDEQRQFQAEENAKNRQAQREYNEYLKEYDRNKARAEELKEAKLELAQLNRDLVTAKPADRAVLVKRIDAISEKYPELDASSEEAQRANDAERAYQAEKTGYISEMPTSFKTVDEQRAAIKDVMASNLRPEDKEKAVAELRSIKPLSLQQTEASFGAIAGHAGKKTGESLDDADLAKKAEAAIKNNTSPSRLKSDVLDKIRELNYTWTVNGWSKR